MAIHRTPRHLKDYIVVRGKTLQGLSLGGRMAVREAGCCYYFWIFVLIWWGKFCFYQGKLGNSQESLKRYVCGNHVSDRFIFNLSQTVIRKRRIWMYGQQAQRFPNKVLYIIHNCQYYHQLYTSQQCSTWSDILRVISFIAKSWGLFWR